MGVRSREFEIRRSEAGPFVSVLTLSGPVENGAQERVRAQLEAPGLASQRVVIDLTEATLYDSAAVALLADETRRFETVGGELVVVSGDNATVDPFVGEAILGLRWFRSLNDALVELLGDVVKRAAWSTELPTGA
jgi:anti-anti-sigma regulatory factor